MTRLAPFLVVGLVALGCGTRPPAGGRSQPGAGGNAGAGGTAGNHATGGNGSGGNKGANVFGCKVNPSACNDGLDNDGDGLIDAADPECVGPCDNDEATYATGIPGDNVDACKQDCFFDGNSGMGDDRCEWNLKCDPANPGGHSARSCPYDPGYKNCPGPQSDRCRTSCGRLTPNGCDCFGCCAVQVGQQVVSVRLVATCKASAFGDPEACPRCTQQPSCLNPCDRCEVCVGRPAPDPSCHNPPPGTVIPPAPTPDAAAPSADAGTTPPPPAPDAAPAPCAAGATYCGTDPTVCGSGSYCVSGCCAIP
jgi:hypothetical protein